MLIGIFLTLGAALCGSVGYITLKQGLETADYKVFVIVSLFIGVVISGSLLWSAGNGFSSLTFKGTIPFLITGSLGGGLLARISITKATHEIGASRTHALTSVSPLVTALFGAFLLNEVINIQLGVGMGVVVIGASFLSYYVYKNDSSDVSTKDDNAGRPILGLIYTFYGMLLFGLHPILRKVGLDLGATPLQGTFVRFLTGLVLYSVYILFSGTRINLKIGRRINQYMIAGVAWALAPLLSTFAVQYISPTVFASLIRVGPLFTVVLTFLFLKNIEKTNWQTGVNALLIVLGAILVSTA